MTTITPAGSATGPTPPRLTASAVACAALAGFAALHYELAWLRQLALVLGASPFAAAAVIAAQLTGFLAGAAAAARTLDRLERPWRAFGVLQTVTAAWALVLPLLSVGIGACYMWALGGQPGLVAAGGWAQAALHSLAALALLGIPTACMGAALPLLARCSVGRDAAIGPAVATLVGAHAFGGACGVLSASFATLPFTGLYGTLAAGAAVNCAVLLLLGASARRLPRPLTRRGSAANPPPSFYRACIRPWLGGRDAATAITAQPAWMLPVVGVAGATAMAYALLWARLLSHVLGSSADALVTVIAIFLAGIAAGSGLAARLSRDRASSAAAFVGTQAAAGILAILCYALLGPLLPAGRDVADFGRYAVAIVAPVAVLLGAALPLAVRVLAASAAQTGGAIAAASAWAAGGAIAGTLCARLLLPAVGFEGTVHAAASVNLALACWVAVVVARRRPLAIAATAAAALAAITLYSPTRPSAVVAASAAEAATTQELHYAVGRTATVRMIESAGHFYLHVDGSRAAAIPAAGSPPAQDAPKWLAALPVAARPDAETVLVIGMGGGMTLSGMPPSVRAIDVVEIESEIVAANRAIAARRGNDPLADPRLTVVINDPRDALRLTDKRYDVIIATRSPPRAHRSAHLYTGEFFAAAKRHLNPEGVFAQAVDATSFDAAALRSAAATLLGEFAHVRLYRPAAQTVIFLASDMELEPELQLARSGEPITDDVMHYSRMGMNGVEDLVAALAMDTTGVTAFAAEATPSTDANLLLASRSRGRADRLDAAALAALLAPHDPLVTRGSFVYTQLAERLDFGYVTRRLVGMDQQDRAVTAAAAHPEEATRLLMIGSLYAARGQQDQAATAFRTALDQRPDNAQARYLLIAPAVAQLAQATAPPEITALAGALPVSAGAVVQAWRHAAAQDWQALAQLDAALGRASVTDAWYPDVVRLRAEWRSKVTQNVETFAFDALRLIDRVIPLVPDRNLYLLRAAIGIALGDGGIAIESSREVVRALRAELDRIRLTSGVLPGRDLIVMRQNLSAIAANLTGDLVAGELRRAESVTRAANEILRYLDTAAATTEQ